MLLVALFAFLGVFCVDTCKMIKFASAAFHLRGLDGPTSKLPNKNTASREKICFLVFFALLGVLFADMRKNDNFAYAPLDLWGLQGQTSDQPNKNTASRFSLGMFCHPWCSLRGHARNYQFCLSVP